MKNAQGLQKKTEKRRKEEKGEMREIENKQQEDKYNYVSIPIECK